MNEMPTNLALATAALRPAERIEAYYWSAYVMALDAAFGLCGVSMLLALLNSNTTPIGSLIVALLAAAGTRLARRPRCYLFLRRHPTVLGLSGLAAAACMLAPAMDANALYYPALAPLAIAPCVAGRRREIVVVIVAIACGTFAAALADTRYPALGRPAELISSTFAVLVIGVLLAALVDWCAAKAGEPLASPGEQAHPPLEQVPLPQQRLLSPASEPDVSAARGEPCPPSRPRLLEPPAILRAARDHFGAIQHELGLKLGSSLTPRQRQVFYLMKADLNTTQSAVWLGISVKSVKRHAAEGRRRCGLSDIEILEQLPAIDSYPCQLAQALGG